MQRFAEFQIVLEQTGDLRQALRERKTVERAKSVVIRGGVGEQEAFDQLRKLADEKGQSVSEFARTLLANR
jgi:response regulator NasT